MWHAIAAIIIFAAAYVCLLIEKWNRTYTALGGALLMILLGVVPLGKAVIVYANWRTLLLMASLIVIAEIFQKTGLIAYSASEIIRRFKLRPFAIMLGLSIVVAMISALIDNVLAIAVIVPMALHFVRLLKLPSVPFLVCIVLSANIGGAATLLGSTLNRMIGVSANMTMGRFVITLTPLIVILLTIVYTVIWLLYRKRMVITEDSAQGVLSLQPSSYLTTNRTLLIGGSASVLLTLVAFTLQGVLGWEASYIGAGGAIAMLAADYKGLLHLVKSRDYRMVWHGFMHAQLLFFLGLFIMVGGLAYVGFSGFIAERGMEISQGNVTFLSMLILWLTSFGSAFMDNVPYAAAMIPVLQHTGDMIMLSSKGTSPASPMLLWWSLLVGAAIGGGTTLFSSAASMLAAGLTVQNNVGFSQRDYILVAAPLSLFLLIVATIYFNVFLL